MKVSKEILLEAAHYANLCYKHPEQSKCRTFHNYTGFGLDVNVQVFVDDETKTAWFAFRGTELEVRDILTDLFAWPSYTWGVGWMHAFFKRAVKKIQEALQRDIDSLYGRGYTIKVTGHSMGASEGIIAGYYLENINSTVVFAPAQCVRTDDHPTNLTVIINNGDPVTRINLYSIYNHLGNIIQLGQGKQDITRLKHLMEHEVIEDAHLHKMDSYIDNIKKEIILG